MRSLSNPLNEINSLQSCSSRHYPRDQLRVSFWVIEANSLETQHLSTPEQEEFVHQCGGSSLALLFPTAGLKSEMQVSQTFPDSTIVCPWRHPISFPSPVLPNLPDLLCTLNSGRNCWNMTDLSSVPLAFKLVAVTAELRGTQELLALQSWEKTLITLVLKTYQRLLPELLLVIISRC